MTTINLPTWEQIHSFLLGLKGVLETLYFLSGISALGIFLQYRFAKKDSEKKDNRESNSITMEQMNLFYSKTIPEFDSLTKKMTIGLFYFDSKKSVIDFTNKEIQESAKTYCGSLSDQETNKMRNILIHLQIFSLNYQHGYIDNELAKITIRDKFLEIAEAVLPVIFLEPDIKTFIDCTTVFNLWRNEKRIEENEAEKKKLIDEEKETVKIFL